MENMKEMIARIIKEVLLQEESTRLLVLVDGAFFPWEVLVRRLSQLAGSFPDMGIYVSKTAREAYLFSQDLPFISHILPENADPSTQTQMADVVLWISLDRIHLSKLADGIADDFSSTVGLEAFSIGRRTLAAWDGCRTGTVEGSHAFKAMLERKYQALGDYGMEFMPLCDIHTALVGVLPKSAETSSVEKQRKVITLEDVANGITCADEGCLITPAARDAIEAQRKK